MGYGFFQDDKGNKSSTRLIVFMVFVALCLAYLLVTAAACYQHLVNKTIPTLPEIGGGVIAFAGLMWAGKEVNKAIENKGAPPPPAAGA